MRTLEDYTKIVEASFKSSEFGVYVEVIVRYKRHRYKFTSNNWQACNRLGKQAFVQSKMQLYGYTLKGAYEAFYREFAKLRRVRSDKLTEIIR